MKAITILQPFAQLIACGAKKIETRSWATNYRGPIAIHAGAEDYTIEDKDVEAAIEAVLFYQNHNEQILHGCIIAVAELVDCVEITEEMIAEKEQTVQGRNEIVFGHWAPGRFAWVLENVRKIPPVQIKGKQRLWEWKNEKN